MDTIAEPVAFWARRGGGGVAGKKTGNTLLVSPTLGAPMSPLRQTCPDLRFLMGGDPSPGGTGTGKQLQFAHGEGGRHECLELKEGGKKSVRF